MTDRNDIYADQLHAYFTTEIVDRYPHRVADTWHWDHTDQSAFTASVAKLRQRWSEVLNPPTYSPIGPPVQSASEVDGAVWLEVPVHEHLSAAGLLTVPDGATRLVVFQHGLGSTPERVMGAGADPGGYHAIGQRLVERGYAVLAPMNLITIDARNRAQDLSRLAGTTMEGIELARCRVLLDAVADLHPDLDTAATALLGISWGGMAAQFWTPLEERFAVAASIGFFNDRPAKMVVEDSRYVTFAARGEHHAFLPGHLGTFSDAELASLVCPRPFLVQHGRQDLIGSTPQIEAEFDRARRHWDELGVGDRVELLVHDGGHEVDPDHLLGWLVRHFPTPTSSTPLPARPATSPALPRGDQPWT